MTITLSLLKSSEGRPASGSYLSPPTSVAHRKSMPELMQESGLLELEIATIQQRIHEIEGQMRELAGKRPSKNIC